MLVKVRGEGGGRQEWGVAGDGREKGGVRSG